MLCRVFHPIGHRDSHGLIAAMVKKYPDVEIVAVGERGIIGERGVMIF